jgi:GT2 family glycosyltransferase/glycosyltransferase involved in cell wall biosynthesis
MSRGSVPPDAAQDWHRIAEARRVHLERLQGRLLFVSAARAIDLVRRVMTRTLPVVERLRAAVTLTVHSLRALPVRAAAPRRQRRLRAALEVLPPAAVVEGAPATADITALIVTATQPVRLARLLAALDRAGVRSVVVDNAGVAEVADVVARHPAARRVQLSAPTSYAAANNAGLAAVSTPWVLLLNDDVEPLRDDWCDRLRAAVPSRGGRPDASAVGAVLVHGRRGWLGGPGVDLTVQHAGIATVLDGALARPVHLGRGSVARPTIDPVDVLAVTGACLLAPVAAIREVGGLHEGYDYGLEDVDLCLRLGRVGPVRVARDAVLLHEEGATRLRSDRRVRTRRQDANRRLLDARNGPTLRRRALAALADAAGDERVLADVARPAILPVVAVHGAPPVALVRALRGARVLQLRTGRRNGRGPAPVLHVVGARARPPAADVPVIGWATSAADAASWPVALLDACDVVVTADGDPAGVIAAVAPTLPVVALPVDATPDQVTALVLDVLRRPRWALRIGSPAGRRGARWGDTSVAATLRQELRAHGTVVRVLHRPDWGGPVDRAADVVVTLKGRGVAPPAAPDQRTVVWIISHPSEVAPGELDAADLVLAGSVPLADHLRRATATPVHVLPQAVDARRFVAGPRDPARTTRLLFLGNSRSVPRPAVMAAVRAGLPLTLVGAGWHRFVPAGLVRATAVPADELPAWYRSADVVLNDHWDEMRAWGLVSNRVLEVLACGGCIVSDALPGLDALVDGAVPTFDDADGLVPVVSALLADPERRAELAARGRAAVLAAHTWEHRAATLVALVGGIGRSGTHGRPPSEVGP